MRAARAASIAISYCPTAMCAWYMMLSAKNSVSASPAFEAKSRARIASSIAPSISRDS